MAIDPSTALPVLVADDDEALRSLYVRALQRAGFSTLEAPDGTRATQLIEQHEVGLVLLDIHMPGIDGVTLVERLRADVRTRTLPVILVTGTADVPDRVRGLQAGADDYVVKSTAVSELVARVEAHVRTSAAWTDSLDRELEDRAQVLAELAGVTPSRSAEETAQAIVERLRSHARIALVSLLVVEADDELAPLAGWAADSGSWTGGPRLAAAASRELLDRAGAGPWIQPSDSPLTVHSGRQLEHGTTCVAPIERDGVLLGLLLIVGRQPRPRRGADHELLAATIDYSAVATALLGPALAARRIEARDRRGLERVIADRAFDSAFQPVVRLADRSLAGFEALTRFDDGQAPHLRFQEALRLGLGRGLETATLSTAIRRASSLPPDLPLGVNVSPMLILEPGWLTGLAALTRRPLVIELTEHAAVSDYPRLLSVLAELRPAVQLAVDDAGAGYASLRHILELRPEYVKLDMALVRGIETDPVRQALVTGLRHFVAQMGSTTVAEGVETAAEADCLATLGIELGQGYLFGRPAPADDWSSAAR